MATRTQLLFSAFQRAETDYQRTLSWPDLDATEEWTAYQASLEALRAHLGRFESGAASLAALNTYVDAPTGRDSTRAYQRLTHELAEMAV